MRKSNWTLIIFILIGLLAGTIVAQLLTSVESLSFLTKSTQLDWHPKADLQILSYDLNLQIRLNLMSLIGVIAAVWMYRRM